MITQTLTRDGYRFHARKLRKSHCERCGTTTNLNTHHKDEDLRNNSPENIQTLCASCHTKHHWDNGKAAWRHYEPFCMVCGKPAIRGLCETHRSRFKRHGNPRLLKKKVGSQWLLYEEYSTPNGPEYRECHLV
ncbi:MAG TPA: hypothetical protein ENI27_06765 [bacterium]|nr:hypothetical protein [bacterium]